MFCCVQTGGSLSFGIGNKLFRKSLSRISPEIPLVSIKGKIPQPRGSRKERQFLSELRTKHSKKPDEIRKRIERMFPKQTKIELFARQRYDGWDAWGNEVQSDVNLETDVSYCP